MRMFGRYADAPLPRCYHTAMRHGMAAEREVIKEAYGEWLYAAC